MSDKAKVTRAEMEVSSENLLLAIWPKSYDDFGLRGDADDYEVCSVHRAGSVITIGIEEKTVSDEDAELRDEE